MEPSTSPAPLTAEETRALFDILTHHETYSEIESFKRPDAVVTYGYPFTPLDAAGAKAGSAPILQTLVTRFALTLPALRDLPPDVWAVRVRGLLARLGEADLSESYDKGAMGTRKTLATGCSALMEMLGRGALGGVRRQQQQQQQQQESSFDREKNYDCSKGEDIEKAWEDVLQGLVYGPLMDELWDHMADTEDLEAHSPAVRAAADYIIIHLATFMHHIFILSPEGPYVLKLIENVHGLVPWKMLKQTLRLGNAATMMSALTRLLLAKLSVAGITNWVRLTNWADDGMNLLQRIISLVLSWDSSEFKKSAERLEKEKAKNRPSDEVLQALRQHVGATRERHEAVRERSLRDGQSIVTAILAAAEDDGKDEDGPALLDGLTEERHEQCMQYYSALLSVRDRDAITAAFCKQTPDLFTQAVREFIQSYDPMIRAVHDKIPLHKHFDTTQEFVEDFIRATKKARSAGGGVEDYVGLLRRHRSSVYAFGYDLRARCPEVAEMLHSWARDSLDRFKQETVGADDPRSGMERRINGLFEALEPEARASVREAVGRHAQYLAQLEDLSRTRLRDVALTTSTENSAGDAEAGNDDAGQRTMAGPGMYLARWQALMDSTPITPASTGQNPVRHGADIKNQVGLGKTTPKDGKSKDGEASSPPSPRRAAASHLEEGPEAPDVSVVVDKMGGGFLRILQEVGGPDRSALH